MRGRHRADSVASRRCRQCDVAGRRTLPRPTPLHPDLDLFPAGAHLPRDLDHLLQSGMASDECRTVNARLSPVRRPRLPIAPGRRHMEMDRPAACENAQGVKR